MTETEQAVSEKAVEMFFVAFGNPTNPEDWESPEEMEAEREEIRQALAAALPELVAECVERAREALLRRAKDEKDAGDLRKHFSGSANIAYARGAAFAEASSFFMPFIDTQPHSDQPGGEGRE